MQKRKVLIFVSFSFLFLAFVGSAAADGMLHIADPDMWPGWRLQTESSQMAAINYENGRENMLIMVDANLSGKQAVWIFPVPASPEETRIDIIKGFPRLVGYDVRERIGQTISSGFGLMTLSQVYTAPFFMLMAFGGGMSGLSGLQDGIEVYEHIEKMGLTTELVTAQDGNALNGYLAAKGLELPAESKAMVDDYVGKDYSFVVSWISDVEQFKNQSQVTGKGGYYPYRSGQFNTLGIYVSFPAEEMYFPLKPTSIYGNARIPISIYVMGYVTPEVYAQIAPYTKVDYFVLENYAVPNELSAFFNGKQQIGPLKYTKIKIDGPSSSFVQDLAIADFAPQGLAMKDAINQYFWVWFLAFFALSSCVASLISGILVLRKYKPSKLRLALLGLFNFLTIIGFTIACHKMGVGKPIKTKSVKNSGPWIKIAIIALVLLMAASVLLLLSGMFFSVWFFSVLALLFMPLIFLGPLLLVVLVGIWSSEKSEELTGFVVVFSLSFLVMVVILKMLFAFLIGI